MAIRRLLWRRGLRYLVDARLPVGGRQKRADLLFRGARVAVFVDGCFWHSCPLHGTTPRSNREWWAEKLANNVRRDRATDELLHGAGWLSMRIWEHEDPTAAAETVAEVVRARTRAPERRSMGR